MDRQKLRALVRTMYDYQDMRIRTAGRLRLKADGEPQDETNMPDAEFDDYSVIEGVGIDTQAIEKRLAKEIEREVKSHPLWDAFFDGVKGCGPLMSAAILAEFDIERATTVSKMWQFAGLNPGMVCGKKKSGDSIVTTDTMVRGDRRTPGFLSPFNGWLRTKLVGVLADCMIRAGSQYRKYYDDYKARLEQEEGWKEETKGHRANAAKRYMIKMFIKDLYVAWRTIEGLEVRAPYQEEYLGHKH